jgi:transporter family protein
MVIGTLLLTSVAIAIGGPVPAISLAAVLWYLAAGLAATVAYGGLFLALSGAKLALVAPIVSSWSILSALLGLLFFDEALTALRVAGISLVVLGNLLLTQPESSAQNRAIPRGPLYAALVSALGFGILAPCLRLVSEHSNPLWAPPIVWLCVVILGLPLLGLWHRKPLAIQARDLGWVSPPAIFEAAGFLALTLGLAYYPLSVVSPLAGLATGLSVLLGVVLLREKLSKPARIGAIAASLGVVLVQLT